MKKNPSSVKSPTSLPVAVQATGDPWTPSPDNPATVPMPWEVIVVNIKGDYIERDRKLYAFLVHAVWDDMETTRIHSLSVVEINKVFRKLGGDFSPLWIWESANRLNKTQIEWAEVENGELLAQGAASLLSSVRTDTKAKESGHLEFEIPAMLIPIFKNPARFARLRIHFMLGLSGKYAVTLYEILESVANMKNPVLEADLATLRQWLKIADGKLVRYIDLKRFAIDPALQQINDNPEGAGFSVEMTPIKRSHAVERIRFTLKKTSFRDEMEDKIKRKKTTSTPRLNNQINIKTATYEKAKKVAPGLDVYHLEAEWREWVGKQQTTTKNPNAAFVSFCKKRYASTQTR